MMESAHGQPGACSPFVPLNGAGNWATDEKSRRLSRQTTQREATTALTPSSNGSVDLIKVYKAKQRKWKHLIRSVAPLGVSQYLNNNKWHQ